MRRSKPAFWCAVWGLALGLGIAGGAAAVVINQHDHATANAKRELRNIAIVVAEQTDRSFQALDLVQSSLIERVLGAGAPTRQQLNEAASSRAVNELLQEKTSGLPHVGAVTFIGADGKLLNSSRMWPTPANDLSDRDYFKALSVKDAPASYISEPVQNRGNGTWTIFNARRITGRSGEFLGLSLAGVDLDYFDKLFGSLALGEGSSIGLFRRDGILLARHPRLHERVGQEFRDSAVAGAGLNPDPEVVRRTSAIDGKDRFIAARGLSHYPITVGVTKTAEEALAHWRDDAGFVIGFALVMEGFITLLVFLLRRHFRSQGLLARALTAEIEAKAAEATAAAALAVAEAELEVARQNDRFAAAVNHMSHGVSMFNADGEMLVCNERYREIYGLPPELARPGTSKLQILRFCAEAGTYSEEHVRERLANAGSGASSEIAVEVASGRSVTVTHRPMPDGGWVATHEDITERRRAEAKIAHMAHHDALTNLPNRVLFRHRLDQALVRLERSSPSEIAVLCIDLDRFSSINDTLGHPFGDELLWAVAARLQASISNSDTAARLGSDTFAVLQVSAPGPEELGVGARRILQILNEPYDIAGQEITIGASIGVALAPRDARDPDGLLKSAGIALHRAKEEGRGRVRYFEPEMDAQMQARRALELDLRAALINREFQLHFQPLMNLSTNTAAGYEALVRWRHPRRGLISPAEFIPIAEETGLIVPLGEWVLDEACREAAKWALDMKVAVNLSPVQFKGGDLPALVGSALTRSGLEPRRLELEITESVLLDDSEANLKVLRDLRALGTRISLDDFGTGYSSLGYLRRFPFDKIKIDQSFIRELCTRDDCAAIVAAVAGLGRALGIETVAEGIETEEQLRLIRLAGCSLGQGYLFSRPLPIEDLAAFLGRSPAAPELDLGLGFAE